MPTESAGAFAGATGVGALCFLGIFLFLDGRAPGVFPTVEFYAKTATWGIVAAVPVLAIAYVGGLLAIAGTCGVMERVASGVVGSSAMDAIALVNLAKDSPVAQVYLQLRQEQGILAGSAIGMLALAVGALAERRNLPDVGSSITLAAVLAIVASVACLAGAVEKGREAHTLAAGVSASSTPAAAAAPKQP